MKISSIDLIEAQKAMTILFGIVNEFKLNSAQFNRKLDTIPGKVAMDFMIRALKQDVEVTINETVA
jgi:hypothetical protein